MKALRTWINNTKVYGAVITARTTSPGPSGARGKAPQMKATTTLYVIRPNKMKMTGSIAGKMNMALEFLFDGERGYMKASMGGGGRAQLVSLDQEKLATADAPFGQAGFHWHGMGLLSGKDLLDTLDWIVRFYEVGSDYRKESWDRVKCSVASGKLDHKKMVDHLLEHKKATLAPLLQLIVRRKTAPRDRLIAAQIKIALAQLRMSFQTSRKVELCLVEGGKYPIAGWRFGDGSRWYSKVKLTSFVAHQHPAPDLLKLKGVDLSKAQDITRQLVDAMKRNKATPLDNSAIKEARALLIAALNRPTKEGPGEAAGDTLARALRPKDGPHESTVTYTQLVGDGGMTCGLLPGGELQCWGSREKLPRGRLQKIGIRGRICGLDLKGMLRCASNTRGDTLAGLPGVPLLDFASGAFHGCGILKQSGKLVCWERTLSEKHPRSRPPAGRFTQVISGTDYSCALGTNGRVECWGDGDVIEPPSHRFESIAAGVFHACGVTGQKLVVCWGANENGELNAPRRVRFTSVSAGLHHSCGLGQDGSITCWGKPDDGRTAAPPGKFKSVMASVGHSCAVRQKGGTICWGKNHMGQTNVPQTNKGHNWHL